jgi:amidohydrolase
MTNNLNKKAIDELVGLRKELHQKAELSGEEKHTPQLILNFLNLTEQETVLEGIGGNGLALIFDSHKPGPTTVFRCELDALPILEVNTFPHQSENHGVAHMCGHDGHMAMVTGLGLLLKENPPLWGKIVLLYQPAEETGEGAEAVLKDKRFTALNPDYIYALHNLPLLTKNTVYIKSRAFAAASRGMIIKLHGTTSHAAEPENGRSPAIALSEIIKDLTALPKRNFFEDFTLVTVVHALLGEIAFGVTPGYAEIRATLRTFQTEDMEKLIEEANSIVTKVCKKELLESGISFTEIFPATCNNEEAVRIVEECAMKNNISLKKMDQPFRWSEDFGHFLEQYKGAIFGLGAGGETPKLHNNDYDFPDELIPTGVQLFYSLALHHNF